MKIKSNYRNSDYFTNYIMNLNIDEEGTKLTKIVNDKSFDYSKYSEHHSLMGDNSRAKHLCIVLTLTTKYPQVELYLKDLLNNFTLDELNKMRRYGWSILHYMTIYSSSASLNTFEIIASYGVDINVQTYDDNTAGHILLSSPCNNRRLRILNLLIKYGINLNIMNRNGETVLDILLMKQKNLNKVTKNFIMTLIDSGATTTKNQFDNEIMEFIESYRCSSIKPAIKK